MRTISPLLAATAALALASCGPKAEAPPPATTPVAAAQEMILDCEGPFGPDASKASLTDYFGENNVTDMKVPGPEGTENDATVLFANYPAKRIEVLWADEAKRQRPVNIEIQGDVSAWTGPHGVKLGAGIDAVEKANGAPFLVTGFGWDYGGSVVDWKGGAFAAKAGVDSPCHVMIRFNTPEGAKTEKVMGEASFASDLQAMRDAKPTVWSIAIGYPAPEDPSAPAPR